MMSSDLSGGEGGGEEDVEEGEVLDIAVFLVPIILGGLLLLGVFIYLVRLGYLKYWRRGLCSGVTSRRLGVGVGTGTCAFTRAGGWTDLESLTGGGGDNEEIGYGGDDFIFDTITGLSEINGGGSSRSRRTTPSSLSSFFSIVDESSGVNDVGRGGSTAPVGGPSTVSRGVQTDRDPVMENLNLKYFKRNHASSTLILPNPPGFNCTGVYAISGADRDLNPLQEGQEGQGQPVEVGATSEATDSSDDACAGSEFQEDYPSSRSNHDPDLKMEASYQLTAPVTPLPILKPILDNISASSGYLPGSSSSSSRSISSERRNSAEDSSGSDEVVAAADEDTAPGQLRHVQPVKPVIRGREPPETSSSSEKGLPPVRPKRIRRISASADMPLLLRKDFMEYEIKNGLQYLQELQVHTKSTSSIRQAQQLQQLQLHLNLKDLPKLHPKEPGQPYKGLIIGVDATPSCYGGYCVNLTEGTIEYYIIIRKTGPWPIITKGSSEEFEMRNCLFALSLWSEEIKGKEFAMFTDNHAICRRSKKTSHNHGFAVNNLLAHFVQCEQATLANPENLFVNRKNNLESFATFIQPADDLSRMDPASCVHFLCKMYSIKLENVKGTHSWNLGVYDPNPRRILENTPFYQEALDRVHKFVNSFNCGNPSCCDLNLALKQMQSNSTQGDKNPKRTLELSDNGNSKRR